MNKLRAGQKIYGRSGYDGLESFWEGRITKVNTKTFEFFQHGFEDYDFIETKVARIITAEQMGVTNEEFITNGVIGNWVGYSIQLKPFTKAST